MPGFGKEQGNFLFPSLLAVIPAFALLLPINAQPATVACLPHVTVWAWERDEDLSYIDPAQVSVAYFAGNIYVQGSLVHFRPRTQKLKLPKGAETIPVFRIESVRRPGARSNGDADIANLKAADYVGRTIANHMKKQGGAKGPKMVQIDFDALEDERPFYKALLRNLHRELPKGTKISITALASWLLADRWIDPGSCDEAVAMLFSIGPGKEDVLSRLKKQPLDTGAAIPVAIGISASEIATNKSLFESKVQRNTGSLYLFSSRPWTENRLRNITREALAR